MIELVKPSWAFENPYGDEMPTQQRLCRAIERIGRTCYKSEGRITEDSAERFCLMLRTRKPKPHLSVFEHVHFTVRFVVDRGVTHELVRHRIAAYSQESTRFCDYGGDYVRFIVPPWAPLCVGRYMPLEPPQYCYTDENWPASAKTRNSCSSWYIAMQDAAAGYQHLLDDGWRPEEARSVLPTALKTEIVTTMNIRQWQHVFSLRAVDPAHKQMQEVMGPLLDDLVSYYPVLFGDPAQCRNSS